MGHVRRRSDPARESPREVFFFLSWSRRLRTLSRTLSSEIFYPTPEKVHQPRCNGKLTRVGRPTSRSTEQDDLSEKGYRISNDQNLAGRACSALLRLRTTYLPCSFVANALFSPFSSGSEERVRERERIFVEGSRFQTAISRCRYRRCRAFALRPPHRLYYFWLG